MKQVVMTIGFCLMAITVFAQKKAVTEAERIAKDSKPDFKQRMMQKHGMWPDKSKMLNSVRRVPSRY